MKKINFITPCFWKSSCYQVHKYWDGRARAPATLVVKTTFLSEQWRIQSTAVTKLITRPTVHGIQKKHIFVKTLRVRVRVESDDRLFSETLNNSTHTLHTLLPPQTTASQHYHLRPRMHDRQLPTQISHLCTKNFVTRALYKDCY